MKRKNLYKNILIIVFNTIIISNLIAQNQIMVSINVMPPFTTNLSDYADNPGKVSVTLTNISGQVQEFYLQAKLAEESRGILLIANQNNTLGKKIIMNIGESKIVDYQTIKEFFDKNSISMQGISEQELLKMNGVPEGIYIFCVQAFSYSNPTLPLSLETNCITMFINAIEPPILQQPFEEAEIKKSLPQNIMFTWSIPPGAEPGSFYRLTIMEMMDPNRDKNDIFNSGILPPFFETTINNNVFIYGPAQPQLVEGRKYAWAVTITNQFSNTGSIATSGSVFKNKGRSEVRTFTWVNDTISGNGDLYVDLSSLKIVAPEKDNDSIYVSDTSDFFVNAVWFSNESSNSLLKSYQIRNKGIAKYKWIITQKKSKVNQNSLSKLSFVLEQLPPKLNDSDSLLPFIGLKMNLIKCDSLGFINENIYQLKLIAYDEYGKEVNECDRTFRYTKSDIELNQNIKVNGSLSYAFEGYSESYPISKTIIKLVRIEDHNTAKGLNFNGINIIPKSEYYGETKEDGSFTIEISKNNNLPRQTEKYKLIIESKYYKQPESVITIDSIGLVQNLGQINTKVLSYSLKLNINKVYAKAYEAKISTNDEGVYQGFNLNHSMDVDTSHLEALKSGVTVNIYRKSKPDYIPLYEGDMSISDKSSNKRKSGNNNLIKVASAKTQIEIINGKEFSYVVFNKLICNNPVNNDDKYFILASENQVNDESKSSELKIKPYKDSTFTAEELLFSYYPKSRKNNQINDSNNFYTYANYYVRSVSPPTSKIQGQLVYVWESNKNVKRPLANTKFDIVVEYLVNGKPMPIYSNAFFDGTNKHYNEASISIQENGKTIDLPTGDSKMIVASGKTDNEGRFTISAININEKGILGTGDYHVSNSSSSNKFQTETPFDPFGLDIYKDKWNEVDNMNTNLNNLLGQNGFLNFNDGFNSNFGYTNTIGSSGNSHGFNNQDGINQQNFNGPLFFKETEFENFPETESVSENNDTTIKNAEIKRVFRIVFSDELTRNYYYNPSVNIDCQAFQDKQLGSIDVYVKEMILKVKIKKSQKENSVSSKGGIKVIVFREPNMDKTSIPAGEGDGLSRMKKLIYPNFGIPSQPEYNTEFEWITDTTSQEKDSKLNEDNVSFVRLLKHSGYQIEACSNPSQDNQYYNPDIITFPKISINEEPNSYYAYYDDTRKENIPIKNIELNLVPLPTRIGVRVLNQSNGKPVANALVTVMNKLDIYDYKNKRTDIDGYVEFTDIVKNNNTSFLVRAEFSGYSNDSLFPTGKLLKYGQQFVKNPLLLYPNSVVKGKLINKKNQPVEAYIMRQDSSYESSKANGEFEINLPSGYQTLYFIPKDAAYFNDSIRLFLAKGVNQLKENVKIYKRQHRIKFIVMDYATQTKISGARLSINNSGILTSNQQGEAKFEFENISYQNFTVKVLGPSNTDYIPQLISFKNNESQTTETYTIKLKKGGSLAGKVKMNGVPVSGTRIYLVQQQSNQQIYQFSIGNDTNNLIQGILPIMETYSDLNGNYKIRGIPVSSSALEFKATLDTSFTVIGDSKTSVIQSGQTSIKDFNLSKYDYMKIASLYGFPIKIEEIKLTSDSNIVKVTGIVDLRYSESTFEYTQGADMARVRDVVFTGKIVNGKRIAIADEQAISIEGIEKIKLRYTSKYNVILEDKSNHGSSLIHEEIKIRRDENNKGYIHGKVYIVDNSFNFPSSYLKFNDNQDFYLCNIINKKVNNTVKAIVSQWTESEAAEHMANNKPTASTNQFNNEYNYSSVAVFGQIPNLQTSINKLNTNQNQQNVTNSPNSNVSFFGPFTVIPFKQYNLCNYLLDSIRMKLLMFDAAADPENSYITTDGKIHFAVKVKCEIANAKPNKFSIVIPEMIIDNNSISSGAINKPLKLELEKWILEVNNWSLNPLKGGFYSNNSYLRTGQIDIPVALFNLRKDMLVIDSFQVSNISLGKGVINLSGINKNNVNILFDNKVGSDMGGHWRVNISGNGINPAARISGMTDFLDKDAIDLEYLQLLSNGENILSIKQGIEYRLNRNKLAKFEPVGITSEATYFSLYGDLTLIDAPRIASFPLKINYSKGNSNKLIADIQPTYMTFESKGFVEFKSNSNTIPVISKDSIIIKGTVEEKNALPKIKSIFYGYPNNPAKNYEIILEKNQEFKPLNSLILKIDSGGISINKIQKDWDLLTFSGIILNKNGNDNISGNRMKFTVYGEVKVNGNGFNISNLSSFPGFELVYEFENARMVGKMNIPETDLGAVKVAMDAEVLFDNKGWYFGAAGKIIVPAFPLLNAKAGIIIGNYPLFTNSLKSMLIQYSPTADICNFKSGVNGFYMMAGKPIVDINKSIGLGPVAFSLKANVDLGADILMNFSNGGTNILIGAGMYGYVKAEMSTITCTNIYGDVNVKGRFDCGLKNSNLSIGGKVSTGFKVSISQGIPTFIDGCKLNTTIFDQCVASELIISTENCSFSLSGDCNPKVCGE